MPVSVWVVAPQKKKKETYQINQEKMPASDYRCKQNLE
jgi:hypothetical protein